MSLLYFFSSGISTRQMYGKLYKYSWIYFNNRCLVRGCGMSCYGVVGGDGFLWMEDSCVWGVRVLCVHIGLILGDQRGLGDHNIGLRRWIWV